MGISESGQYDEVDNSSYLAGTASITASQVELKVGASRLSGRQNLIVFNKSNVTIYIGPNGVTTSTGIPIEKNQMFSYPFGADVAVYGIAASGTNTVIVHEVS